MPSIDERVVSMAFENAKFEANVAKTMSTLSKLEATLKNIGKTSGLSHLEAESHKVTFVGPMSALEKLKAKLRFTEGKAAFSELEASSHQATFAAPSSALDKLKAKLGFGESKAAFSELEASSQKATFTGPMSALDKLKAKLGFGEGKAAFSELEASSQKATFTGPMSALDKLKAKLGFGESKAVFSELEASSQKATFTGPMSALDKLKAKLGFGEAKAAFSELEAESHKVTFSGISGALDKVKAKLGFPEAKAAFAELEGADDKVNFADASGAVDGITAKFGALQVAGVTAFATIVSRATTGLSTLLGKVTGVQTIIEGFADYELKIGATQTIMAGTGEDINTVTKYLKDLDIYADRTIYSLRDMTSNIGKFTNAGVKLPVAVDAMKGISNVAALSGANAGEAARAMYNLGQAIGQGTVRLMDWRSVELANMGTKEFKEELIKAAVATGDLKKGADGLIKTSKGNVVSSKNFTTTLQDQWLTSEALVDTLQKYANENTNLGKRAYAAATDVKTFSMMLETLAAAAGTGWTDTFDIILGDLPEATKMWTTLTNTIGGFLGRTADARNEVLKAWDALGGRTALIEGIKNAWAGVMSVITPLKDAFREIFPRKTGQDLFDMTVKFRDLMANLKLGPETAENLKRTFAGFFAILSIGKTIVGEIFGVIFDLIGVFTKGSGGVLGFTGSIGDFLVALDNAISKGKGFAGAFDTLSVALQAPLQFVKDLISAFGSLIGLTDNKDAGTKLGQSFADMVDQFGPLKKLVNGATGAWEGFLRIIEKVRDFLQPFADAIVQGAKEVRASLEKALNEVLSEKGMNIAQTGLLAGIFAIVRKGLQSIDISIGGDVINNLNTSFEALTGTLTAMQRNIQAATLLEIALALTLLAGAIVLISGLNADQLQRSLTGLAVGLGAMVGAMALLSTLTKGPMGAGFVTLPIMASGLVLMAVAVDLLAVALTILSKLSWDEIARGLTAMGGALLAVAIGVKLIGPQITIIAPSLVVLAFGMNLLAASIVTLAQLSWEEIGKGLFAMAGAFAAMGLGLAAINPLTIGIIAPGLLAISVALIFIAQAVGILGRLDLATLGKGLAGIGLALALIGIGVGFIPPTILAQAAGLLVLGIALTGIAAAVALFGNMDLGTLAKGLISMGLALVVMGLGLSAMGGTLLGAAALMAAALAMAILVPTLAVLGSLPFAVLLKGLLGLVLILGTLAIVGLVAAGPLAALGGALLLLGQAMVLITGSIFIFASALRLLAAVGTKGLVVLGASIVAIIALIPKMIKELLIGFVEVLGEVVKLLPKIAEAIGSILDTLLQVIIESAPKLAIAVGSLILAILTVLNDNAEPMIAAGWKLIKNLLKGFENNIQEVVTSAQNIITKFLNALAAKMPNIVEAGVNLIVKFLNGIISGIPKLVTTVARLITTFINSVSAHIPRIVTAAGNLIARFIIAIGNQLPKILKAGTDLIIKFLGGIQRAIPRIKEKALDVARTFLNNLADGLVRLANIGFNALIKFLNGLAEAIRDKQERIRKAGWNIASAIMEGIVAGFKDLVGKVVDGVKWVIDKLPDAAKKVLKAFSPSKVFRDIGRDTMLGLVGGIDDGAGPAERSIVAATGTIVDTARSSLAQVPAFLEGIMDMDPVITPVLDLSNVERGAQKLVDLTNVTPITAAASYTQAATISSDQQKIAEAGVAPPVVATTFNYEQNNYSPDPLSNIEIYRRTNNQLAQVKSALGVPS